ncbi:MAG: hypothetical protein AMJ53_10270 [Gammaproteobacteria bacterium SG8_11]|nr:MAG: hypothetical protein AMJ53_10270 [Gammaproteobacteria bacterium SG8_11]
MAKLKPRAKPKAKVFISDDHAIVRQGLIDFLERDGYKVVGESATVADTVAHCYDKNPDILILDLNMDTDNGINTIETLLDQHPDAKILIFSMRESLNTIRTTYKMGTKGYVTKSAGPDLLLEAVEKIASGRNYYMPGMLEQLFEQEEETEKDPREVLTERDLEIFTMVAEGHTNEEIAEALDVTEKSVANRISEIRKKLGIRMTSFEWIARKYNILRLEL